MSARVKKHLPFIKTLLDTSLSARQKTHLLRRTSKQQVLALAEVVLNFLKGSFDISGEERSDLFRYRDAYRRLAQPRDKLPWAERQTLLVKYAKALLVLLHIIEPQLEHIVQ